MPGNSSEMKPRRNTFGNILIEGLLFRLGFASFAYFWLLARRWFPRGCLDWCFCGSLWLSMHGHFVLCW